MDITAIFAIATGLYKAGEASIEAIKAAMEKNEEKALQKLDEALAAYDKVDEATGSLRDLIAKNREEALEELRKKFGK